MKMKIEKAFTLIELLIVISIIIILAAVLFPIFARARLASRICGCQSNLRQLYVAINAYTEEYDGLYPPVWLGWDEKETDQTPAATYEAAQRVSPWAQHNLLLPYCRSKEIFHCPADNGFSLMQDKRLPEPNLTPLYDRVGESYREAAEMSWFDLSEADLKDPSGIFLEADSAGYWHSKFNRLPSKVDEDPVKNRADSDKWAHNTLFADGHLKVVPFWRVIWIPYIEMLKTESKK